MANLNELFGKDKTPNGKRLGELKVRVSKLEKDRGLFAPTEMEMYGGDKGFHKFGSDEEQRIWELNQRLDRIQRGGTDATVELLKLDMKKGIGDKKEAIVDDLVYRPHERTIEAQLGRLEQRIDGMENGKMTGKDVLPIDIFPIDKSKGIIGEKPAVADKDAAKVAESIKAEEELELPLKMYEKATEDMEKFKKELFEKGKTKDDKVNLSDLSKDERDKYAKLEKKLNAAGEILKLEVQEKMPHLKEEYADAAIGQVRKDTATKTNKAEITIQNDVIDLEPRLKKDLDLIKLDKYAADGSAVFTDREAGDSKDTRRPIKKEALIDRAIKQEEENRKKDEEREKNKDKDKDSVKATTLGLGDYVKAMPKLTGNETVNFSDPQNPPVPGGGGKRAIT